MLEIYNWQDSFTVQHDQEARGLGFPKGQWDFWETPSTLLAAHIGQSNDNFSIRILDERVSPHTDQLCVDMAGETRDIEHMCLCFAGDNRLACAAVESINNTKTNVIKLFDLRMVTRGTHASASILPSFPRASAHGLLATETFEMFYNENASVGVSDRNERSMSRKQLLGVCDLTCRHDGSLNITTKNNGHYVFDLIRQTLLPVKLEDNAALKGNLPIYAVDKQFGSVAAYEASNSSEQTISLYACNENSGARSRGYKRKSFSSGHSKIKTTIQDCYGLQTQISGMEFNDSGTAIVGVSNDGDVFTWRT